MEPNWFLKLVNYFVTFLWESFIYLSNWKILTRLTYSHLPQQLVFYILEIIAADWTEYIFEKVHSSPVVQQQKIKC
jgi:hypothetical protein